MGCMCSKVEENAIIMGQLSHSKKVGLKEKAEAVERYLPKAPPVEYHLTCTLEELYRGTTKDLRIIRNQFDRYGDLTDIRAENVPVEIPPGCDSNERIIIPKRGDLRPGIVPADIIVIVHEEAHATFKRSGESLITRKEIPLIDALTCDTLQVETLDKRIIAVPNVVVTLPGQLVVVVGEGMPCPYNSGRKGCLYIEFDVIFPKSLDLSSEQKEELKKILMDAS